MSEKHTPIFGIDLGTTYSCIAYVDEYNRPTVVPNSAGDRTTPSVVQFDGDERIVGKEAKNASLLYPDTTVELIKREMGSKDYTFYYQGEKYTPEEISSYIIRKLVQDAAQYTGYDIRDVVITCPAYFGIPEREATARAGQIAGLNVRSIINEPTAAAIAYGVHEQADQVVLVYDLGGGTFDITMIEIKGGNITVICTDGDHFLGGRNWDELIVTYLAEQWQRETGSSEDPLDSPETLQDLYLRAEQAKYTLTQRDRTDVSVAHAGQRARITLTREKFDELTEPLLSRTVALTRQALAEAARRGYTAFDQLLLVGGSSRMPQVSRRLAAEFGIEPKLFEPDEAVAKGAAIFGQKLLLDQEIRIRVAEATGVAPEEVDVQAAAPPVVEAVQEEIARDYGLQIGSVKKQAETQIVNVTSRSFGVVAWSTQLQAEVVSNLIRRNDPLPASATQRFGTRELGQATALIQIVDNLSTSSQYEPPPASRLIAEAELRLPPGLPAGSPVEITFDLNEQGRLHAHARELTHGQAVEVEIETELGATEEEIAAAERRARSIVIS
ncbi:MAG: Hsp70 family protein [Anaerolineae bacterium]|nr:Hsp70 family protein [Anaerolineae bacterium]